MKFDFSDFERVARNMNALADQVPFALANALSSAAFRTRELLITDTWPQHVEVRNRNLLRQSLRVQKARKTNLAVAIVDEGGPASGKVNLLAHAKGGVKTPHGKRLAIPPSGTVRRTSRGVVKGQRPRAIIDNTPKRALRVTSKGIFVGEGGRLHLRYVFKTAAQIKADVPFFDDFNRYMRREMAQGFEVSMRRAMKTAFRK